MRGTSHVCLALSLLFSCAALKNPKSLTLFQHKHTHTQNSAMAIRVSICFFLFALTIFASSSFTRISAEEAESKEFVLTLDHTNFSDIVSKQDFIVVEFYAPWYDYNSRFFIDLRCSSNLF